VALTNSYLSLSTPRPPTSAAVSTGFI
jgi:hypothetical protein